MTISFDTLREAIGNPAQTQALAEAWLAHRGEIESRDALNGHVADFAPSTDPENNAAWLADLVNDHGAGCATPFIDILNNDGFTFDSGEATPERTLAEAVAAGEYHPDLLPLFEKFSKVADDAGHCAEYDRLARSAGAPTRAEVRRLVQERDGARFRVTVPVVVDLVIERDEPFESEDEAIQWAYSNVDFGSAASKGVTDYAYHSGVQVFTRTRGEYATPSRPLTVSEVPITARAI